MNNQQYIYDNEGNIIGVNNGQNLINGDNFNAKGSGNYNNGANGS